MTEERKRKRNTTTITLKRRTTARTVQIPIPHILSRLEAGEKDGSRQLWNYFKRLADTNFNVHDSSWLKLIVDWTPEGGLPLSKMAPWFKLAEKTDQIPEDAGDYDLELSSYQVQLIWKRITDERFKLNSAGPALRGFILDFQAATGKHFEDEDPS